MVRHLRPRREAHVEMNGAGPLEPRERGRTARVSPERAAPAPGDEHARCPYCHDGFGPDLVARECWACRARHHARCMNEHGGCSVFGCEAAPRPDASRPVVIRAPREHVGPDEDWREVARRERAAWWSEQQRGWNRMSGALLGLPALFAFLFLVAAPLDRGLGWPLAALAGVFLGACALDVARPTDQGVGRALAIVHALLGGGDDAWMR